MQLYLSETYLLMISAPLLSQKWRRGIQMKDSFGNSSRRNFISLPSVVSGLALNMVCGNNICRGLMIWILVSKSEYHGLSPNWIRFMAGYYRGFTRKWIIGSWLMHISMLTHSHTHTQISYTYRFGIHIGQTHFAVCISTSRRYTFGENIAN